MKEGKIKLTDDQILNFLGLGIDVKTLAEDQMYDDWDGNTRQRLESRMEMIIDKADEMMAFVSEFPENSETPVAD